MPFRQLANKNTSFQFERILFNKPEPLYFTKNAVLYDCELLFQYPLWTAWQKKSEGNRELFSMCISRTAEWKGSLVLVLGQPWLSYGFSELSCISMNASAPRNAFPWGGSMQCLQLTHLWNMYFCSTKLQGMSPCSWEAGSNPGLSYQKKYDRWYNSD